MPVFPTIQRARYTLRFACSAARQTIGPFSLLWAATNSATACKSAEAQSQEAPRAVEVRTTPAPTLSLPEKIRLLPEILATGSLKPERAARLTAAVPGILARLFVKRGDEVKSGAPLAALEASGARAALAQAEANVLAARAQLALAADTLARINGLSKEGAISTAQVVQSESQHELAAAQLQAAIAQRTQARVSLEKHVLTAPFAGVIVLAPDAVGGPVGPESPLFVLEDMHRLILETSLTQEEAAEIRKGTKADVLVTATGARVSDAVVQLIVPSVEQATNRVPLEIAVPNPEGRLLPHAFARAVLPAMRERDAYRVPQAALTQDNGSFSLWMVSREGKVVTVGVRVLANRQDGTAVVDAGAGGFPEGARVIDSPPVGLTVGAKFPEGTR